jgi:hypothetical protein
MGLSERIAAEQLNTMTRDLMIRIEKGSRPIPGMAKVAFSTWESPHSPA